MSTFFHPELACPGCGRPFTPAIIKGLHVTRLPEVRAAILDGSFQRYACAGCGRQVRVERTNTVYTDFGRGHYVAVESLHRGDWRAAREEHARIWDSAFLLGPPVAEELSGGMLHRLVFGTLALREKLLAWDNALDDLVLEAVKGDALRARGLALEANELRLSAVHPEGPLVFTRLAPPAPRPAAPEGVDLLPERVVLGPVLVPRGAYTERIRQRGAVLGDYPWLADDWVVDLLVTHPARA